MDSNEMSKDFTKKNKISIVGMKKNSIFAPT